MLRKKKKTKKENIKQHKPCNKQAKQFEQTDKK